ncbi:MAG: DUF1800 domain-containing protein [Bacteroidia bacterium]|jgi:uncharacterized protein (DUF1800 family)|nr:DUF1800 domain-containing protein [Bacteroidia bacterium]
MSPNQTAQTPSTFSLSPYTGPWTEAEAAHLLRRTMFGPTYQQIQTAVANGMSATLNTLLTIPTLSPPVTWDPDEAVVPQGQTWVNSVYPSNDTQPTENARLRSLASWVIERLNTEQVSIAEKMCLFWQNHFACEAAFDSRATYNYLMLIRQHALGNFKQLVKDMTIDPTMLIFLDGYSNNVYSPNENYSRELLELYSIGKGPQVSTGDYTSYTEGDVAAGAKILTGWYIEGLRSDTVTTPYAVFENTLHDQTTKTLSARLGNAVVNANGAQEYSDYIDIIFSQPDIAKHICKKLYRYFVNFDITPTVMTDIIDDMAQTLVSNNFNVLPVMQQLLSSAHFYDMAVRGSIIRSPLDMFFAMYNATGSVPAYDMATNGEIWLNIYWIAGAAGQDYLAPPNVGGWPAYYQAPSFSRLWVSSSNLKLRFDFAGWQTAWGGFNINGNPFSVDTLNYLANLPQPDDPVAIVEHSCVVFCPKPVSQMDKLVLKTILCNGLPDFEWTIQYNDYVANPGDETYADPVRRQVALMLMRLFKFPQFQTF